ncbi:hypothetical protein ACFQYP_01930 [Nonomuraea antimicrobica]
MNATTVTFVRARDIYACAAGLLRFAAPDEVDPLLGDPLAQGASVSYGLLNRPVTEALLRRPGDKRLPPTAALLDHATSLLGQLLDLDDPQVNGQLFLLAGMPRNLLRQLAHQTSRRDGVTPVPLPSNVRDQAVTQRHQCLLLHAADPGTAAEALRSLGRGRIRTARSGRAGRCWTRGVPLSWPSWWGSASYPRSVGVPTGRSRA